MPDTSSPSFIAGVSVAAAVGFQVLKAGATWLGPLVLPAIFARPPPAPALGPALAPAPNPTPGNALDGEVNDMRRAIELNASTVAGHASTISAILGRLDKLETLVKQIEGDFARVKSDARRIDDLAADVRVARDALVDAKIALAKIGAKAEERDRARLEQLQERAQEAQERRGK